MTKQDVMEEWEESWSTFKSHRTLGDFFLNNARTIALNAIKDNLAVANPKIIDVGCGYGDTVSKFRQSGYNDTIGIDHSASSILLCQRRGLKINTDVFQADAFKTGFDANSFDIVFSEGLLEHFTDFKPIVKEMCRISKRDVLLIQPNHYSVFKKISDIYYFILPNKNNVKEYTYRLKDFEESFQEFGFRLQRKNSSFLGAFWILLFKKTA
jgi:ubiquinone/menaquinone biosynthesis C-methylase UbiE